jgi:hypothetical protein
VITVHNAREHRISSEQAISLNTSPTMKRFAASCWNVASVRKICLLQKLFSLNQPGELIVHF